MNIIFLAPFGIRPKGTVLARMLPLAVELQRIGHSVTIVSPPYTNPEDSGKTEIIRNIRLINISLSTIWKPVATILMTWRMLKTSFTERPDIVHLFKPKGYGGLAAIFMIALRNIGIRMPPLVVDTDDWEGKEGMNDLQDYSLVERTLFAFQEQWLLRHAEAVTVASRELETIASGIRKSTKKVLYLPNCVDGALPGNGKRVRLKHDIPVNAPILLIYTRFFEFDQNKLHRVLEAVYHVLPEVRFLVVGKGRHGEEGQLAAASQAKGFSKSLVMAGWVEPKDLPDYLAAGDVAIYPFSNTLTNRCKCPAKLTEILQAGIPVVADRVGQSAEYIVSGVSGILCDPDDWQEMSAAAVELLRKPSRRLIMGTSGRDYLLKNFAWHSYGQQLSQFYLRSIT